MVLNRYKVIDRAGSGAFGTVLLAWDTRIQRKVAIKCLELSEMDSALDEARTAAMLSDQNIVAVYDFETHNHTVYLIMEYVEGLTLSELLRDHDEELSLDIIAAVLEDVAHALSTAHENQVLHLDIKPDNVLINRNGQCKVTDFGLATLADSQGFGTAGGGTIGYMPPEQMQQGNLDASCDQWALASIMYEMLSGSNPFVAPDLKKALAAIEDAELVLPSLCWDGMDPGIDDVIFTALDPDRDERWASVRDFKDELMPYLGDPEAGHRALAAIVNGEDPADDDGGDGAGGSRWGARPLFYRTSHIFSCLSAALLVAVACLNVPAIGGVFSPPFWIIVIACAAAGAWKEHLAPLLGLIAFGVVFVADQQYGPGIFLIAATAVWWFFIGRKGVAQANSLLAFPVLGAFGAAPAAPLVCGVTLPVGHAIVNAAFGSAIAFVLAGLGSQSIFGWYVPVHWNFAGADVGANVLVLLQTVPVWCVVISWLLAAIAVSLCNLPGRRWLSIVGIVVGAAILIAGAVGMMLLTPVAMTWQQLLGMWLPTILGSAAMVAIVLLKHRFA